MSNLVMLPAKSLQVGFLIITASTTWELMVEFKIESNAATCPGRQHPYAAIFVAVENDLTYVFHIGPEQVDLAEYCPVASTVEKASLGRAFQIQFMFLPTHI